MPLDFSKIKVGDTAVQTEKPGVSSSKLDFSKIQVKKEDKYSLIETALMHGAAGILPATGGLAGASAAMIAAAPVAAISGPFAPVVEMGAALVGGIGAGAITSAAQEALMPEEAKQALQESAKENSKTAFTASLFPNLAFFTPGRVAAKTRLLLGGVGSGIETGRQLASREPLDFSKIAIAGGAGAILVKPTRLGGRIAPAFVEKPTSSFKPSSEPIPPTESVGSFKTPPKTPEQHVADWGKELTQEVQKQSLEAPVATEGIPTPQEVPLTQGRPLTEAPVGIVKDALDKLDYLNDPPSNYHPKDAIEIKNWVDKQLQKTVPDQDGRAELQILKQKVNEVVAGDQHPSIQAESGIVINRTGNYIDVVEVPKDLQKKGLGTKIIENLETDIRAEGHKTVFLLAKEESVPFWEKQGYRVDPSHVFEKGENVPMSKALKSETPTKIPLVESNNKEPLAITNKDGSSTFNDASIEQDFRDGFKYIFEPTSPTGLQKLEVFKQLGITKEQFSQIIRTPEEYKAFIKAHEDSHILNRDHANYPKNSEGKIDLTHPDAIAIEARATRDAINAVQKAKIEIPEVSEIVGESDFNVRGKDILKSHGPEAATKFAKDYRVFREKNYVEVPETTNPIILEDALYNLKTKDAEANSEVHNAMENAKLEGITPEIQEKWSKALDGEIQLTPEEKGLFDKYVTPFLKEANGLAKKTGEATPDYKQPSVRLWTPKSVREKFGKWWKDITTTEGAFAQKMNETPDALQERNVFALEMPNGVRRVIQFRENRIVEWKNGEVTLLKKPRNGETFDKLKWGDFIGEGKIVTAKISEKEKHTPYRYSKDVLFNVGVRRNELLKLDREKTFLREFTETPAFRDIGMDVINKETGQVNKDIPAGWVPPNNIEKIPELAGKVFDPHTAAILEDWSKHYDRTLYSNLTSMLIKNMMLNPLPHMLNEVAHLFNLRGATGWLTPKGLVRFSGTIREGVSDVIGQSKLYQEVLREGGSLLSPEVVNKQYFRNVMDEMGKKALADPKFNKSLGDLATKVGMSPLSLYNAISKGSNKWMWITRDAMYMQVIHETMKKNPGMSVKDAIGFTESHMPNYRLPSVVMGSRKLSKILGNPNIAVFSRYHYGLVKAASNIVKGVDPRNLQTTVGRAKFLHSLDSLAAISLAYGVVYPYLDKWAKEVTGLQDAEVRRAGPYHLIHAAHEVATGKKDPQALAAPVLTWNPILLTMGQLGFNRELYSGKQIYHANDPARMITKDVGKYLAKSIPQYGPVSQGVENPEGARALLAKQFDIKGKSLEKIRRQERAAKYVERERKKRLREEMRHR